MAMEHQIRIVGPQFSEPSIVVRWLEARYQVRTSVKRLYDHDSYFELHIPGSPGVCVRAANPAHWEPKRVYDFLLGDAQSVIVLLNRVESVRRLNAESIELVTPLLAAKQIDPVVAANDPHGGSPAHPTVSAAEIERELSLPWPVREITAGPFEATLRWDEGMEALWHEAVRRLPHGPAK